jgi:hypothetical protein
VRLRRLRGRGELQLQIQYESRVRAFTTGSMSIEEESKHLLDEANANFMGGNINARA